jgi:transposase
MLGCAILPAHVQDRDGCLGVLKEVRRLFPFLERVIADGAYQGKKTARAVRRAARARLEIVKRSDAAKGFVVLQKRWIVERTFGWLGRCRRLAKDFEALTRTHLAFVQLAMIRLMMRRIARASQASQTPRTDSDIGRARGRRGGCRARPSGSAASRVSD